MSVASVGFALAGILAVGGFGVAAAGQRARAEAYGRRHGGLRLSWRAGRLRSSRQLGMTALVLFLAALGLVVLVLLFAPPSGVGVR